MTIASQLIRPMTAADPEPAADLLRRGDFGDRLGFFQWAIGRPTIRAFVAEDEGRIIGTGVASAHGHAGWVGVIYVDPAFRGGGLGRRITRTVIDHLEANGVRSMVLIASPMGRPVYEREGFTVLDRQVRFTIDGLSPADTPPDPRLRPFAPRDLDGSPGAGPRGHRRGPQRRAPRARRAGLDDRRPRAGRRGARLSGPRARGAAGP